MLEMFARAKLARAAVALNQLARSRLPPLVLITDDERLPNPLVAASKLPRGSMVIVRARQSSHRAKLAHSLRQVVRARGLVLLVANDPVLADRTGAHGLHLSEGNTREACAWRARRPGWLITAAAHTLAACALAKRSGADAAFVSPVFATASHPGIGCLGAVRARMIGRQTAIPIYALGGVNGQTAMRLSCASFVGLAAIDSLAA